MPSVQRVVLTLSSVALGQPVHVQHSQFDSAKLLKVFTSEKEDDDMVDCMRKQTDIQRAGNQAPEDAKKKPLACCATGKFLSERSA